MPHITFEYTENILEANNLSPVIEGIHNILVETLPASLSACKSRVNEIENYLIGDGDHLNAFIHLTVKIKAGRSKEVVTLTANKLLELMQNHFQHSSLERKLSISVEITEISDYYVST